MALRNYELMMVLLPTMEDDDVGDLLGRVNRYVEENGGSVESQEKWGSLRKLAFPINDYTEGNYILSNLRLEPESVEQLEAMIEVWENVLRHLVIRVDEFPPAAVASVEPTEASSPPASTDSETPTPAVASEESTGDSASTDSETPAPAVASEESTGDSEAPGPVSDQEETHDESTENSTSEPDGSEDNSSESDPAESESDSEDKKE